MSIEQHLDLKFPIYWNSWPIEKNFAKYLIYKVVVGRPINIVELGSGTSSLIILKTLKKLGINNYKLVSIDSDEDFLENTKNLLLAEDVYCEERVKLIHAPIVDLKINNNIYKWYDKEKISLEFDKIDLFFIDGPIGGFCKNARYPAMKIMRDYLKDGSVVIMHDAKRTDEKEIIEIWKNENKDIKFVYYIDTERGGVEFKF